MITHLKGKLVEKNPTYAIVECNGVGYFLNISLNTYSQIPDAELVTLYTQLIVREDAHTLYGFTTILEREIFKLLISVSGIGPSIARTMLSSLSTEEIQRALATDNVAVIQSVKGIGVKTAQKVIIELKDKIVKTYDMQDSSLIEDNSIKQEALSALEVLGFVKRQAEKVVTSILKESPDANVEKLIKLALKKL
ncbi:Holliday junction branch migration protein RuvA [Wenyingzhuangia sp. 2_MG-2023]|uniref:Holliday junction branch migration protein RuvA n=1 Tax=Wenyingzhuangia sp. 2_MG-2023 TaxID=3062639 RepID=UPI0026E211F9|nr:Holliday junction branch migration protein RuvA [Wenyingzhuangia sp. 2_MG-2023]MDO6736712.1 Holliday junction branch migration protein RuvA [Wenyingzhuangia sp. 2_MG-2023]MDO6800994.1 Holliday junction branch migration protein RuvA [Wenyingzhuangia sp. 1_MG-2023]